MTLEACSYPLSDDMEKNFCALLSCIRHSMTGVLYAGLGALQGAELGSKRHMLSIALTQDSPMMERVRASARAFRVAVALGYLERADDQLFISQIFIDENGKTLSNYRRACGGFDGSTFRLEPRSPFEAFTYRGKTFAFATGSDLLKYDRIAEIRALHPDVFLWSLITLDPDERSAEGSKRALEDSIRRCGGHVVLVDAPAANGSPSGFAAFYHDGKPVNALGLSSAALCRGGTSARRQGSAFTGYSAYCDLEYA